MPAAVWVEKSRGGEVHTIILRRPHAKNAVDGTTAEELHQAFLAFEHDEAAKCAVLFGEGGVFCAGADLKAIASAGLGTNVANPVLKPGVNNLELGPMGPTRMSLSKPVIAAVESYAVAGGLELACWCDLGVCDTTVVFGVFCRRWGVPLVDGGTVRLPRLIGHSRAMDMILTGRPVGADEALMMGLANYVVAEGRARQEAEALAEQICSFPQACLRADRKSALSQWGLKESDAVMVEYMHGKEVLSEVGAGASKFTSGAGRAGSFLGFGRGLKSKL